MEADFSGCIEFTAAYCNFFNFNSGKFAVSFDCTGDEQKAIIGKDPTSATEITKQVFFLEYAQLGCTTTSARLWDGSGGGFICGVLGSDVSGVSANTQSWDFRGDPMRCLTAESTQGICLSSGDGRVCGFIKGFWGTG